MIPGTVCPESRDNISALGRTGCNVGKTVVWQRDRCRTCLPHIARDPVVAIVYHCVHHGKPGSVSVTMTFRV